MNVLITGANGFIGKHLTDAFQQMDDITVQTFTRDQNLDELETLSKNVDVIYHLAGVNRPTKTSEYISGNIEFTKTMTQLLSKHNKKPTIVFSSSIHAASDNPYGQSKQKAEEHLIQFAKSSKSNICIYRLPNVFGKWCKPNYNSVVATFAYNIARNKGIQINDPSKQLELVYIDDVIHEFTKIINKKYSAQKYYYNVSPTYHVSLQQIADKLQQFKEIRQSLIMPDLSDGFTKKLYSTFLSYLDTDDFRYDLETKTDHRGSLAELLKSKEFGQIFISKTREGFIRGNHYHHSKVEKFCVLDGTADIKLRNIFSKEIISYRVSGDHFQVVDIPPGYTHSIQNVSDGELTVLFWANEIFDPHSPDTFFLEVENEKEKNNDNTGN